jgi:predicted RNase H-like nuclease (RuvC/YqgF family)
MSNIDEQIEYLTEENTKKNKQIEDLFDKINKLEKELESIKKSKSEIISKSFVIDNNNNDLSIIIKKYKKSILIQNMYNDKNTTHKCKEIFKELGAKWFKHMNEKDQGWLFVGKNDEKEGTLEDNSKFIVEKLSEKFKLEYEYKNE